MSFSPASVRTLLVACALTLVACDSSDGQMSFEPPGTTLTVMFLTFGTDVIPVESIDYTIGCLPRTHSSINNEPQDSQIVIEGALDLDGRIEDSEGVTYFWRSFLELPEDTNCLVQLRARDEDGEIIWTATETFAAGFEPPSDLYFQMGGDTCFCAPTGSMRVTVDTVSVPHAESVTYAIDCLGTADTFLDNENNFDRVTEEGFLATQFGDDSVEIRGEPTPSLRWSVSFPDLPTGPCLLLLSAFGPERELLCETEFVVGVGTDIDTQAHVLLPCAD